MDASRGSYSDDFRPRRLARVASAAARLARAFPESSPLGLLGVIAVRCGKAETLSPLGAAPGLAVEELLRLGRRGALGGGLLGPGAAAAAGDWSLFSGLTAALDVLETAPAHGRREILVLCSSLPSVDATAPAEAARRAARLGVRVSAVGLGGEVRALRRACSVTPGGALVVAESEAALQDAVLAHISPPEASALDRPPQSFPVGFAAPVPAEAGPGLVGPGAEVRRGGWSCPRCLARAAGLPGPCFCCGLLLVGREHLAQSLRHLFVPAPFERAPGSTGHADNDDDVAAAGPAAPTVGPAPSSPAASCAGCFGPIGGASGCGAAWTCTACRCVVCAACEADITELLHVCPGCCARRGGD